MKIRSAAVLGAGAVGAYLLYALIGKEDLDLCVVADGERKERLEKDGIVIDDGKGVRALKPQVRTPQEARGVDLLLVAVKYTALDAALEDIRQVAAPGTIVLSLLNGVDSEEKIATVIDPSQIVYSLMRVSSERRKRDGRDVISFICPERHAELTLWRTSFRTSGQNMPPTSAITCRRQFLIFRLELILTQNTWPSCVINCSMRCIRSARHLGLRS